MHVFRPDEQPRMKGDSASAAEWEGSGGNAEEDTTFRVSDLNFCPEELGQTTAFP